MLSHQNEAFDVMPLEYLHNFEVYNLTCYRLKNFSFGNALSSNQIRSEFMI